MTRWLWPLYRLDEAEAAPWWVGLCWYDSYHRQAIVAPWGLNLLVAAGRWAWLVVRYRWSDRMGDSALSLQHDAQVRARKAGMVVVLMSPEDWQRVQPLLDTLHRANHDGHALH